MSNQLKILHVLSQRPDSTGSGIYIQAMIRESEKCGFDNFLVAGLSSDGCNDRICIPQDRSLFVNFYRADLSFRIPGMSDVMPYESSRYCDLSEKDLRDYVDAFSRVLTRAVDEFKPDVIHSHHLWIVSSLTRQLFPTIPMATTCHGTGLRQLQNCSHLQDMVFRGCRDIELVMALNQTQKNEISRLYGFDPDRIAITGAGYNDGLFHRGIKPDPDPVQLVYAGKLSNAKGVPWFLRALGAIQSPQWHLHLVGGGSGVEKEHCLEIAKKLGQTVCIHGAIPQSQLAEIFQKSHILVLPSFFEGLPLVLLEGLASGCRVVATDLPGTKEIFGNADADYISLVPTPRLKNIDQPYEEDELSFEQNLTKALRKQMDAAVKGDSINLSVMKDTLDAYTWTGVFAKVKEIYLKLAK